MTLDSLNDRELHRGPSSSKAFNERNERIRKDITRLYGLLNENDQAIGENMGVMLRENFFLQTYVEELKANVTRLESMLLNDIEMPRGQNYGVQLENFYQTTHIENGDPSRAATIDRLHGVISPKATHTASRVSYETDEGHVIIPKGLDIYLKEATDSNRDAQGQLVYKDVAAKHKERLVDKRLDTFWLRDVSFPQKDAVTEVFGELHIKLPTEGQNSLYANTVVLHPYPEGALTIRDIQYKGVGNQWSRLENFPTEIRDEETIPVPVKGARKLLFQFGRVEMTEIRIFFSQPYAFEHDNVSTFTYGFQNIDIQHRMYTERSCEFVTTLDITDKHALLQRVHEPETTPAPGTPRNLTQLVSHHLYYDASLNDAFDFGSDILTPLSKVYIKTTLKKEGDSVPVLKDIRIPYVFKTN